MLVASVILISDIYANDIYLLAFCKLTEIRGGLLHRFTSGLFVASIKIIFVTIDFLI